MALRGQRFELDLDADEFIAQPLVHDEGLALSTSSLVGEIKERSPSDLPPAPKSKSTKGFPEHRTRGVASRFRQLQKDSVSDRQAASGAEVGPVSAAPVPLQVPPSDKAILYNVGQKYGYDFEARQKAEISEENKKRIAQMSEQDIAEARAELMANLDPALIQRLLRRANIDDNGSTTESVEDIKEQTEHNTAEGHKPELKSHVTQSNLDTQAPEGPVAEGLGASDFHFPVPPRAASSFVPLDPDSPHFLEDLKTHYFPDTPHDPSTLEWLQDPGIDENNTSPYNPDRTSYAASALRFSFSGKLIPPQASLDIDPAHGLHHHGEAPSSAGYTIPELALLSRSTLPNQRCVAYQVVGRILYRLGKGDFGPRGSELQEGLWSVVEKERTLEVIMAEANRSGGHVSAKAYATEALWLWRKGGGGDRGLLKENQKVAK